MKRLLLFNPPTGRYIRQDRCQAPVDSRCAEPARPPMELAYAAAVAEKAGAQCRIRDYPMEGRNWEDFERELGGFRPEMIIAAVTTPTVEQDLQACRLAKKINPAVVTAVKGAHCSVFDRELIGRWPDLDLVIRGEAEETAGALVSAPDYAQIRGITFRRDGQAVRNTDLEFIGNLDSLPFPARHLLNNRLYRTPDTGKPIAFINTGRGCPFNCIFCAAGLVSGQRVRQRSPGSVIVEIEECMSRYGIREFFFAADTFTSDREWVRELCMKISEKKFRIRWGANSRVDTIDERMVSLMKHAGCAVIGFGAESASQRILDKIGKGVQPAQIERAVELCAAAGIESFLVFVVGLPWETRETVTETRRFILHTRASFIEVNVAYPIPGTGLYKLGKDAGLFDEHSLGGHDYGNPVIRSFSLSTGELAECRQMLLRDFYFRPGYIARRISRIRCVRSLYNHCRYGLRLARNLMKR